jgi:hypothetical protein
MQNYVRTAQPLIDFYKNQGLLISINADGPAEDVCQKTITALKATRNYANIDSFVLPLERSNHGDGIAGAPGNLCVGRGNS